MIHLIDNEFEEQVCKLQVHVSLKIEKFFGSRVNNW